MSKLLQRGLTLLCLFVLGCAAAPQPVAPASPPVVVAEAAEAAEAEAPPPPAAAARQGERSTAAEGMVLEGDEDQGAKGDAAPVFGAVGRGIGGPADGAVAAPRGAPQAAGSTPILDGGVIPVTAADPQWGNRDALVTIVQFGDFQCPFCAKAELTLTELRKNYGPDRLRIVWKNSPLSFHTNARSTAEVAMIAFQRDGNDAFWAAHDAFFADQKNLPQLAEQVLQRAGVTEAELARIRATGKAAAKIDADMDIAKAAGAMGTPAFFINGIFLSGAQPIDRFTAIIDDQIQKAKAVVAKGTPRSEVYTRLAKEQHVPVAARAVTTTPPPPPDTTVHRVLVGGSPVRGKASALVTIVEFADYQCPFCGRVEPTLQKLGAEYGDKVRLVWKNSPLPFHHRAVPAAQLALEARAQKGDAVFFQVHDALFASQRHLEDADLLGIAAAAGLDTQRAMAAVAASKHKALIDADLGLSDELKASGTPHFFINGRRLVGAQSIENFRALIDEELAKAEAMVKAGTPASRVYDKIMAKAQAASPPGKKSVPSP